VRAAATAAIGTVVIKLSIEGRGQGALNRIKDVFDK
jgi:hypothetical protein